MILCTFILSCHCHHHPSPGPFHLPELKLCARWRPVPPSLSPAPGTHHSTWAPWMWLLEAPCVIFPFFLIQMLLRITQIHLLTPQFLFTMFKGWEAGTYLIYSLASINKLSPTQVTATRDGKWCLNRQRKRNVVLREYEWLDLSPQWETPVTFAGLVS